MPNLRLQQIDDVASPWLEQVAALYRASFPASERKPIGFLTEAVRRPDYQLLAAFRAELLVAMAVVYRSAAHDFALLEYMAVLPAQRGAGIGGKLLTAIAERLHVPLLLEVESVRGDEPGADLRWRRIDFYRRHGCREVAGLTYRMPRVSTETPPPMVLMVLGWSSSNLPGRTLRSWLADIYDRVYEQTSDSPQLASMQEVIAEQATLI